MRFNIPKPLNLIKQKKKRRKQKKEKRKQKEQDKRQLKKDISDFKNRDFRTVNKSDVVSLLNRIEEFI